MQSISHRLYVASIRNQRLARASLFFASATAYVHTTSGESSSTQAEAKKPGKKDDEKQQPSEKFDLTKEWASGKDFFKKLILTNDAKEADPPVEEKSAEEQKKKDMTFDELIKSALLGGSSKKEEKGKTVRLTGEGPSNDGDFFAMAKTFAKLSTGDAYTKEQMVQKLIVQARETSGKEDFAASSSFADILMVLQTDVKIVADSLEKSFGTLDLTLLGPTNMFYYLEREDGIKNPSWKNRMHRFHPGIDIKRISYLNDMLQLSDLSYADTMNEIADGCKKAKDPLELVYCDTEGSPNKPAHFVALRKDQSIWSSELEVTIVVRGTKTITDMMTDCVVDSVDYRGGKAHSGILDSGKWIVSEQKVLLEQLRKHSKKRYLKVRLVGHSLGAGAAAIAGMEFNDMPNCSVEVVGFGCPSLLSPELSKATEKYITTVISDSDVVPRMSAATVVNVLLDIMEYDWTPYASRDIEHALGEVRNAYPYILSQSTADSIMGVVDKMLDTYVKPTIKPKTTERLKPELCPPGMCVHLYKDGSGISGAISPATFFQEIDITRRLVDDHFISTGYQKHLLDLMRQYTNDHNFRFDEATRTLVAEVTEK
jgi:hypothetical protein